MIDSATFIPPKESQANFRPALGATLVSHPDIYITENGPKIFFLGSGKTWKAKTINHFSNNWLENHIVMCFYEGNTSEELLPWIYYNITNSDFLLFHIEEASNELDMLLVGLLAHKTNVFISATRTEKLDMVRALCKELNKVIITDTAEERIETLKKLWNKN
jgi:hypothetical protein